MVGVPPSCLCRQVTFYSSSNYVKCSSSLLVDSEAICVDRQYDHIYIYCIYSATHLNVVQDQVWGEMATLSREDKPILL